MAEPIEKEARAEQLAFVEPTVEQMELIDLLAQKARHEGMRSDVRCRLMDLLLQTRDVPTPNPKSSKWPEQEVYNLQQFVEIIQEHVQHSPTETIYVYRGQTDACKPLMPTLIRDNSQFGLTPDELLVLEESLKDKVQAVVHLHHDAAHLPDEPETLRWWALMQHYGVPTRLLDWTASAYVAAYFATADIPWIGTARSGCSIRTHCEWR